jgi:protein involved in polysaccharide export with SLBB domain
MRRFAVPPILAAALWMTTAALGQTKTDIPMPDLFQLKSEAATRSTQPVDVRAIAMDGPLDASAYMLGPGDLLALNIWTSTPVEQQLSVTPEGYLVIPNVGRLKVNGLTLDKARRDVSEFVAKRYPRADISLILLSPRKVSVQITGQVLNEGKQEISSASWPMGSPKRR